MRSLLLALILVVLSNLGYAAEFGAVYKQGEAPFQKGDRLQIGYSGEALLFRPEKQGRPWQLGVRELRGCTSGAKGIWVFWFSQDGVTHHSYLEMLEPGRGGELSAMCNSAVAEFYQRDSKQYRVRYETYREEALKTAQ